MTEKAKFHFTSMAGASWDRWSRLPNGGEGGMKISPYGSSPLCSQNRNIAYAGVRESHKPDFWIARSDRNSLEYEPEAALTCWRRLRPGVRYARTAHILCSIIRINKKSNDINPAYTCGSDFWGWILHKKTKEAAGRCWRVLVCTVSVETLYSDESIQGCQPQSDCLFETSTSLNFAYASPIKEHVFSTW